MKNPWTPWVARRFLTGRRGGRGRLIFLFSVVLICTGVATLNTILAVMNGLQQGYIQSILEIGSYHIRWSPDDSALKAGLEKIREDSGVLAALPFKEGQTMLNGNRPRPVGALLRALPENALLIDEGMASRLKIVEGSFDIRGTGIVLGDELALNLGVEPGDTLTALNLTGAGLSSGDLELEVQGLFQCGYRDYESSLAFISIDTGDDILGDAPTEVGVKLKRPESDRSLIHRLEQSGTFEEGSLSSWRDSNRAFFGALRTEKVMMLLLLALIFVVVAVNIDHSLRRMATERTEDLSILKAMGASPREVRVLFLRHGFIIGGVGGLSGSLVGVLIGSNVDRILRWFRIIRGRLFPFAGNPLRAQTMEAFFKSSQVMMQDVIIILFLAILLTFLAALRSSTMAARSKPAEVLRSE